MMMENTNQKQPIFIGHASVKDLPSLPGGCGRAGRLLALGNMPTGGLPAMDQLETPRQQASFAGMDYIVAGTDCNLVKLLETIHRLKKAEPGLKVVLADCAERPVLQGLQRPGGVESVIAISQEQGEVGRGLLLQQAGILAGPNAGMAAFLAFLMEGRIEAGAIIGVAITNLSPELLGLQELE